MHWIAAGLILFSFAAPGSVVGVGFTFASGGLVLGALMCVGCTLASVCGALLLLKLRTHLPDAKMMSDLGAATIGPVGAKVGLVLQMTNFVLYLPVALMLTGEALQDALEPSGATCQNYFMFAVALVCFASTQARSLSNGAIAAFVCLLLALGVAVLQIAVVVAHPNDLPDKNETKLFGNYLMDSDEGKIQLALALTTCLWAYIPSLLTIELASEMERPADLARAIWFSAGLNVSVFIGVGATTAYLWGADLQDPITITWAPAWPSDDPSSRALAAMLCAANAISYCLDSIPLARACQRAWCPDFDPDSWTAASVAKYAAISAPTFLIAVMLAVVVGQPGGLFTMLALVTAITLPGCNLVFPACCALMAHRRNNATNGDHDGTHATLDVNVASLQRADDQYRALPASDAAKPPARDEEDPGAALRGGAHGAKFELSSFEQAAAYATLVMGIVMFFIAWYGAIGKITNAAVRGPEQIGCAGWGIWKSDDAPYHGWFGSDYP